jgi:hypothetical protein
MGSEKYGATTLFYRESISSPRLPSLRANSGRLSVRQRFWVTDLRLCMYNIQYWLLSDTKAPTERENGWISTPDQDHDYPPRGEAAQAFQSGWSLGCACKWAIRQRCVADRAWMAEGGSAEYLFCPVSVSPFELGNRDTGLYLCR